MTALTTAEQSATSINATRANKVVTFFLRRTSGTGGQSQQNPYFAKGADGVSLYVGDNNDPFDANMRVWRVHPVSETVVTDATLSGALPAIPAHETTEKKYELNVPATTGDPTWEEATGGTPTVTAVLTRTEIMAPTALTASSTTAQEFTMNENLVAGYMVVLEVLGSPGAYVMFASSDVLANTGQSSNPFSGQMSEALALKIQSPGDNGFGQDSIFVWRSDEANKIWLKNGRDGVMSVRFIKHAITVTVA